MCIKFHFENLNLTLALTPHKYLYLWSDHRTKGGRWYYIYNFNLLKVKYMVKTGCTTYNILTLKVKWHKHDIKPDFYYFI